jgi:hypothetical protein
MKREYVDTVWDLWTYDVWGNAGEGWQVNDRFCLHRKYPLRLRVKTYNPGMVNEFQAAELTDTQIRQALHLRRIKLDTDGDDVTCYVNHASSGYPLGELHCVSHESLSPIRRK